jgi:1,4-dihydroxy-2-naphthoyl-CoA hydrolase
MSLTIEQIVQGGSTGLPGHLGIRLVSFVPEKIIMEIDVAAHHNAPNGYLHAGAVVTLADTACGYATMMTKPEGATGFTTIELKTNFFATTRTGIVQTHATPVHQGRNTQVWDADVIAMETGKRLALFRCTQMILWPKA